MLAAVRMPSATPAAAQGGFRGLVRAESGQLPEGFRMARTGKGAPAAWASWTMPAFPPGACWRRPARTRPIIAFRWRSTTCQRQGCRGGSALQGRGRPGRSCRRHRRAADRCRQLLCAASQCLGGQRQLLSCRAAARDAKSAALLQRSRRIMAHAQSQSHRRQFTIGFDGKTLFTAADPTFANAGKIALWTKADSVTRFDNLTIRRLS